MALNLAYTILWGLYVAAAAPLHVGCAALLALIALPFDRRQRLVHYHSRFVARSLMAASPFVKIKVKGAENINKTQPCVIVSNHQSMMDILFLYRVPLCFKWVSKREAYRIPLVGALLWLHNDVTIKRGNAPSIKKMLADCSLWLQKQVCIFIFPEGTRSRTGQIGRFKEGAFTLAKNNGVPILPVAICGTREFCNGGHHLLNARQTIQITILPPISAQEAGTADAKTLAERAHSAICAEYARLRSQQV